MEPQTFVFIGRSGCGKGTQAELLSGVLRDKHGEHPLFYLETGQKFRDFISAGGYTNELARTIQEKGGLQPAFLAVWMWANLFIEHLTGDEHVIVDGTPRKLGEAIIFVDAMKFYGRKPVIVYLNVSRTWSEDRLKSRHRIDDITAAVKSRLDWFDTDVLPAVEYFRTNEDVIFLDVDAERSIEDIHGDIVERLQL